MRRLILPLLALLVLAATALGQSDDQLEHARSLVAHQRPNADSGPTRIEVAIFVIDVKRIVDVDQTMNADFYLQAKWRDPRLALHGDDATGRSRQIPHAETWFPPLQVVNLSRVFPQMPRRIIVDDDGNCAYFQRYVGTLSCPLDLRRFPFDRQIVKIDVACTFHTPDDVELVIDPSAAGRRDAFSIVDWQIGDATVEIHDVQLSEKRPAIAGYRVSMPAKRYAMYYIFKIITPLVIIIGMSWAVFWIDPKQIGPQIGLAATSLLTLIAYRFLLGNLVPKVSYLTRLDIFIFASTLLVFIALIETLVSAGLAHHGREDLALRVDRVSRGIFPIFLVALLWISFG